MDCSYDCEERPYTHRLPRSMVTAQMTGWRARTKKPTQAQKQNDAVDSSLGESRPYREQLQRVLEPASQGVNQPDLGNARLPGQHWDGRTVWEEEPHESRQIGEGASQQEDTFYRTCGQ